MDFESLKPYLSVVAAVIPVLAGVVGFLFKRYVGRLKAKLATQAAQLVTAQSSVNTLTEKVAALTTERDTARQEADGLRPHKGVADHLATKVMTLEDQAAATEKAAATQRNRVQKALALEGAIWTQPVMAGTRPFRPLSERRTPIVSVLNLKGGVGKTTLTAYLGWAMAARGYRVLLVDLDLQGSLSSFFIPNTDLRRMEDGGRLLRHYLDTPKGSLLDLSVPLPQLNPKSRLIATTDKLAYSELKQTFRWLMRVGRETQTWTGRQDARMILRKALHAKGLTRRFDLVLLDCPPLLNLCGANALAASDFVLVPVTPSVKAIERVPTLMKRVREVQESGVNPALRVLGMVAARTQEKALTARELDLFRDLPQQCRDVLHDEVEFFDTHVPQRAYFRDNEDAFTPPDPEEFVGKTFAVLAEEFGKRLPGTCKVPTPVSKIARARTGGAS